MERSFTEVRQEAKELGITPLGGAGVTKESLLKEIEKIRKTSPKRGSPNRNKASPKRLSPTKGITNKFDIELYFDLERQLADIDKEVGKEYYARINDTMTRWEHLELETQLYSERGWWCKCRNRIEVISLSLGRSPPPGHKPPYEFLLERDYMYAEIFNKVRPLTMEQLDTDDRLCLLYYSNYPSDTWLREQMKYTLNLNQEEKDAIHFYTFKGDELLNGYLKQKQLTPELKQMVGSAFKEIEQQIKRDKDTFEYDFSAFLTRYLIDPSKIDYSLIPNFIQILNESLYSTILRAPKLKETIKVYRGLKTKIEAKVGDTFTSDSFTSTSLSISRAINFALDKQTYVLGSILEITLNNVNCLMIDGISMFSEQEVLLPYGMRMIVTSVTEEVEFSRPKLWVEKIQTVEGYQKRLYKTNYIQYKLY